LVKDQSDFFVFESLGYSAKGLKELLSDIEGIIDVEVSNDIFQIACSRDATADIAKAIVAAGKGLNYLNKKEYGLNDIYYRYFEGGESHE
jgi:ABC-2 type transport system ATP-binding protein